MRLFTDRKLLIACLLGSLPFVAIACFTDARGWSLTAVAALTVLAALGSTGRNDCLPDLADTQRFLNDELAQFGFSGAFRIEDLDHRITSGRAPDCANVHFRASLTITEPLYQATVLPADQCASFTPRRLAALFNVAEQLAPAIRASDEAMPAVPPDPYTRTCIVARSEAGWKLSITGSARATHSPQRGWHYVMTDGPRELDGLVHTGRPRAAFVDAVVLDSSDGRNWLAETIAAWTAFENELARLRSLVDTHREQRGTESVAEFFASCRAGSCFQGTGETIIQANPPVPFFLEFTALDATQARVAFTLRRDRHSPDARNFQATVEADPTAEVVRLSARTQASDAVPEGGPLLNASTAFSIEFIWDPVGAIRLKGRGADFVFTLHDATSDGLDGLRALGIDRERAIWAAVTPGTAYGGSFSAGGVDQRLLLSFLPGAEAGGLSARLECADWSGIFTVCRCGRQADATPNPYDLILEPVAVPAPVGAADSASTDAWQRLFLQVDGRELVGVIEQGTTSIPITLRR